ncbi:enkurin-like [Amphiprion ocellaris]|uniref:enkurin-like n=1 Tax=Amphiprion ocellaris TaxID=80972 RepID=UPI002411046C|nr:enkurin-like [Amphiprion ocellaris]
MDDNLNTSVVEIGPWYVSKFRPTVVQESKLTKDAMRTMGPAKVELPSPDKYLKKPSKESKPLEVTECSKDAHKTYTCTEKKPPVPSRTDNPLIHTKRDFIKTATAVPKKQQPMWVDTNTGHKQPLENSGLVPKYIKKKDYGKVPAYLQQRNEEKLRAEEEYSKFVQEQREQRAPRRLPDEERRGVLISDQIHSTECLHFPLKCKHQIKYPSI